MTIAENLLLLALDEDGGERISRLRLECGLAAAVLVELQQAGRIDLDGPTVALRDSTPVEMPGPDRALARIAAEPPYDLEWWVRWLRPGLLEEFRGRLVQRGIVTEEHRKRLGLFPTTDRHLADPGHSAALRARLAARIEGAPGPDDELILLSLAHGTGLAQVLFDLPQGWRPDGLSEAVAEAIRKVTAAVAAAAAAATV